MSIVGHLRIALRHHLRQPVFVLTIVGTLALTIGATTTMFTIVNTVLVRALPFASPDRLVWIASVRPDNPNAPFSLPELMDYRRDTRTLTGIAAYANWSASLAGDEITERLTGARMSANAFELLGVSPAAGRLLNDADDASNAPPVVVLSYRVWQRKFGGSRDVVGTVARINGESFTIVGVLPAQFPLPVRDLDIVTPLVPDRDPLRHVRNSVNFLRLFGRLREDTGLEQAQAELTAVCRALRQQFPVEYVRKEAVRLTALHEAIVGEIRRPMLVLFGAVIVVLATAMANLVSLALVRANGRRGELAMRIAVGASRFHLVRQLTAEALLVTVIGTGIGWMVAAQATAAVAWWAPASVPRLSEATLDWSVAVFAMTITMVVTMLLAAAPLGVSASARAGDALRAASRGAIGDRWNHRLRNVMVVGEISAALVLLLATAVLVENLLRLQDVSLGFDPDGVFQARLSIPPRYRSPEDVARFYEQFAERLTAVSGVEQVGVISVAPLSGLLRTVPFSVPAQSNGERDRPSANLRAISSTYPTTVGTRLLHGRLFTEDDRGSTPAVALVSAALADRVLAGNAVGQRLLINDNNQGPRPIEIVGVLENVRQTALDDPPALDIYIPLRQVHPDGLGTLRDNQFWMVKTATADPATFRSTFVAQLRGLDVDAAVSSTGTMRQYVDEWLEPRRFNLTLFGAFALTAVLLAVSGLYGLVAYAVSQRAAEISLRMAIGATQRDVSRMILGQACVLGVTGILVGLALAVLVKPVLSAMVQTVAIDPVVGVTTLILLIMVVLIAAWIPAGRAARTDPTLALRGQ